jgi:phage terminase large subunit-like protein
MDNENKIELFNALLLKKKQRGLEDLYFFNKYIIEDDEERRKLLVPHVHGEWAIWYSSSQKRICEILVPRSCFKSSFFTIGESLRRIAQNPSIRILIANATLGNAQNFLGQIKNHIQNNEVYKSLYGDMYDKNLKWNDTEMEVKGRHLGIREATVTAVGVGGNLVSQHYDLIICDDLINDQNSATRFQAEKVIDWWKRTFSLLEPDGKMLIVGTRWSYYELYAYLEEEYKNEVDFYIRGARNPDGTFYFPERFDEEKLLELKKLHGSYIYSCNPYEAPVLMDDWTCKPIGKIRKGDRVVGWSNKENHRRKLVSSKVVTTGHRIAKVVKITMESGRTIRCTPDHKWFTGRSTYDTSHATYLPARIGSKLMYSCDPYISRDKLSTEKRDLANWLGGFYDGEGSFSGNSLYFAQSIVANPEVCQKLEYVLTKLGYKWNSGFRKRSKTELGILGGTKSYYISGGFEEKRRFILECNPIKKQRIINKMFWRTSRFIHNRDRVVSIVEDGEEEVYSFQTETGNYFVWGYASKNCFYENSPIDEDNCIIKESQILYWTENDDEVNEITKRLPDNLAMFSSCDPAVSQESLADSSAFISVGVDSEGNWWVKQADREKVTTGELIQRLFQQFDTYNPITMSIEVIGQAQNILSPIRDEERVRNKFLPLSEIKVLPQVTKTARIRSILQPRFENGKVYIHKDMTELKDQLLRFPKAKHDDLIDGLAQIETIAFEARKVDDGPKVPYSSTLEYQLSHPNDHDLIDEFLGEDY